MNNQKKSNLNSDSVECGQNFIKIKQVTGLRGAWLRWPNCHRTRHREVDHRRMNRRPQFSALKWFCCDSKKVHFLLHRLHALHASLTRLHSVKQELFRLDIISSIVIGKFGRLGISKFWWEATGFGLRRRRWRLPRVPLFGAGWISKRSQKRLYSSMFWNDSTLMAAALNEGPWARKTPCMLGNMLS